MRVLLPLVLPVVLSVGAARVDGWMDDDDDDDADADGIGMRWRRPSSGSMADYMHVCVSKYVCACEYA